MSIQPRNMPFCMPKPGSRSKRSIDAWASAACRKFFAASAVLMGVCVGHASAAVVTYATNFDVGFDFAAPTPGEVGFDYLGLSVKGNFGLQSLSLQLASLQRFDAALGTLTGVSFGFFSTADFNLLGSAADVTINFASDAYLDALLEANFALTLVEPAGAAGYTHTARVDDSCFVRSVLGPSHCEIQEQRSIGLSALLGLDGAALDDFIGEEDINFFASATSNLTGYCQEQLSDSCLLRAAGVTWQGVATVVYTYDAASGAGGGTGGGGAGGGAGGGSGPGNTIPEPASAWLAGLALAGLAAQRRSRRGATAA